MDNKYRRAASKMDNIEKRYKWLISNNPDLHEMIDELDDLVDKADSGDEIAIKHLGEYYKKTMPILMTLLGEVSADEKYKGLDADIKNSALTKRYSELEEALEEFAFSILKPKENKDK
tara:strand:+ start:551 stop:904 length:354 start_codon:yes stop_codon:yes gene_type:complete